MRICILKHCWRVCPEVTIGEVPKSTKKANKARNAKKAAGKILRWEGLGRRVPGGSAESDARPHNQVIPRRHTCRETCKFIHTWYIVSYLSLCGLDFVFVFVFVFGFGFGIWLRFRFRCRFRRRFQDFFGFLLSVSVFCFCFSFFL